MANSDTEVRLSFWRSGPTQAERLCAGILRLEGYADVEPQSPLGGRDGRADIFCSRGGYTYVAAVYFPPTNQIFKDIFEKFNHDIEGATRHQRRAFAFFTNQRLSRGERGNLKEFALKRNLECEIYDVERIAGALDEASGYGLRAAYVGISMNHDEQIAYFVRRENYAETALDRNTTELKRIASMISRIESQNRHVAATVRTIAKGAIDPADFESMRFVDPLSVGEITGEPSTPPLIFSISPGLILMIHRMVCFELPSRLIGRFRTEEVSMVDPGGEARQAIPYKEIPEAVQSLCSEFKQNIENAKDQKSTIAAIAIFHHHFLVIHPFLDGNGRTARALLLQQCIDIFGRADMSRLDRGVRYQKALQDADSGKSGPLSEVITAIIDH